MTAPFAPSSRYSRRTTARLATFVLLCTLAVLWTVHRNGFLGSSHLPSPLGGVDFLLVFPTIAELQAFAPTACGLRHGGHSLYVVVAADPVGRSSVDTATCNLRYQSLPQFATSGARLEALEGLVARMDRTPTVVIYSPGYQHQVPPLDGIGKVVVKIPDDELRHSEWMGLLTLAEWKNWEIPQVEVTIVTQDRPASLRRLLTSLQNAHYFGEDVRLRINMDRKADPETRAIVDNFKWHAGPLLANWRITQGGLMTAVTESWFPAGNHTYGIILEDDIQVSPHFYAWTKMALLRYRYGAHENRESRLFGISLYNQQTQELRTNERQLFDAPKVFEELGMQNPHMPYLSQVPCSWGAVYFPEHWREFHAYLDVRLRGHGPHDVIPDIPSNSWATSWKRYFNELVFLRGYVMLYPNFADRLSLSTNHVEVGEHVGAELSSEALRGMRAAMAVPLMQDGQSPMAAGALPDWYALPVMDLRGYLSTHGEIVGRGDLRRKEISKCPSAALVPFEAYELLCHKS